MNGECLLDREPTGDGGYLCRRCTARLGRDLDAVPDLVADLLITLTRQDHVQATQPRGGGGTPLAFSTAASGALHHLGWLLGSWARCVAEELHAPALDAADNPIAHAAWLARRTRLIRHLPMVDDLATEIGAAIDTARRAVDVPPESSRFLVGPCPIITDGWFCDGDVQASISTVRDDPSSMTCQRCGHHWGPESFLRGGKLIANRSAEIGWQRPRPRAQVDT